MEGRVVVPYLVGSRVPRRLRLGPLIRRILFLVVSEAMLRGVYRWILF